MQALRNISIRRKLVLVVMLTVGASLLLAGAFFLAYDLVTYPRELVGKLSTLAEIIGANSTAALLFTDPVAAEETLGALSAERNVVSACIYGRDGEVFATYARPGGDDSTPCPRPQPPGYSFGAQYLILFQEIRMGEEQVGTVFLRAHLRQVKSRLRQYATIVLVVLALAGGLGLLLSSKLQEVVSGPLLDLVQVARAVTSENDFSIRARKQNEDETGLLTDAFNQMLTKVEESDRALRRANEELERRVEERTRELQREFAERRRAEEQLRQLQKMEAVGQLAAGVAHDFNNILTVIKGFVDISTAELSQEDPLYWNLQEIGNATMKAAGLTRQLLAFSRKQVLHPTRLNLGQVISGMEKMLRRLIGENVELVCELDPALWPVKADAGQIEQVIMNLAVNARDAMPLGGKLTLQTTNVQVRGGDPAEMELGKGDYVLLAVSDTGVGMTEEVKRHLFEPFFTTKGKDKGTGLGLATSYGIIRQSGGHILVSSEMGVGTTFRIYLPRVEKKEADSEGSSVPAPTELPRGAESLLVVEDDEKLRLLVVSVLRGCGYQVREARDGQEALELVSTSAEPFQLVLTDVIMPRMGGKELQEHLQRQQPRTRVLFLSGYTDDALAHHGVLAPGIPLLEKPFSPLRLATMVRAVLDQPWPLPVS